MNTPLNDALLKIADWMASNVQTGQNSPDEPPDFRSQFDYELSQCADELRQLANTPESSAAQGAMGELIGAQSRCYELHPKTFEVLNVREWFDLPIRHGSYEESARISMTFNGTDGAPRGYETRMIYAAPFGKSANIAQPSDATAQPRVDLTDDLCEILSTVLHFIPREEARLSDDIHAMCGKLRAAQPSDATAPIKWTTEDYVELLRENKSLHIKLAGETLRANQGWSRYESANKAHMSCLNDRLANTAQDKPLPIIEQAKQSLYLNALAAKKG